MRTVTYEDADGEDAKDVEDEEAPQDPRKHDRHNAAGIFGLASSQSEVVGTSISVGCRDKGRVECEEFAPSAFGNIRVQRSRVLPVPETKSVVLRVSSDHSDD